MNSIPQLLKLKWMRTETGDSFACQGIWAYKMSGSNPDTYFRVRLEDAFKPEAPPKWEPVDVCGSPLSSAKTSCTPVTLIPPPAMHSGIHELVNPSERTAKR